MGADLSGEIDDGTYELTVRQSALANGRTGKVELTTSYPAIEDFLAEYKFEVNNGSNRSHESILKAIAPKYMLLWMVTGILAGVCEEVSKIDNL